MTTQIKYGSTEYDLEYSVEYPDYSFPTVIQKNPLTGEYFYKTVQWYDTFAVKVYLWNYVSATAKFTEIEALKGKRVYFKPHFDSDYIISQTNSAYIYFYVLDVIPYQIQDSELDFMIIRLASEQFINQDSYILLVDENGDIILDQGVTDLGIIIEE